MGNRPEQALRKRRGRIGRILLFFLKTLYLLPLFALGLWLLSAVYLRGVDIKRPFSKETARQENEVLKLIAHKQDTIPRDHFHMVDENIVSDKQNQPLCVICHGSYSHGKDKKTRAILNMHAGFIACYVCHARIDSGPESEDAPEGATGSGTPKKRLKLMWVDQKTGAFSNTMAGEYGKYPAMIFPIDPTAEGTGHILTPIQPKAAQAFLKMLPELTPDQVSKAKAKLHEPLSKQAVTCADCHKKDGYLDFKALGFPRQRIDHLISTEFVGMFSKYETFYLPSVIDFGGH